MTRERAAAATVFLTALVLRLVHVMEDSASPFFMHPVLDALSYHQMAEGLLEGAWPGPRAFAWPPLYPVFVAGLYRVFGDAPEVVRIAQSLLGALSCVLTLRLGRQLFESEGVALGGALACALAGPLIYFDGRPLSACLETALQLGALVALTHEARHRSTGPWLAAGACLGMATINRGGALLFLPAALAWLFVELRPQDVPRPRRWRAVALLAPALLCVAPVAWHNARHDDRVATGERARAPDAATAAEPASAVEAAARLVSGRSVLLGENGGFNLYLGNAWALRHTNDISHPDHFDTYVDLQDEPARAGVRTSSGFSKHFSRKTRRTIADDPAAWGRLMGIKLGRLLGGHEIARDLTIYPHRRYSSVLRALLWERGVAFPSGIIIPLGLLGLALAARRRRRHGIALAYVAIHAGFIAAFYVTARYRAPLIPVLALYGASALHVVGGWARGGARRKAFGAGVATVALVAASNAGVPTMPTEHSAFERKILGTLAYRQGRFHEAIDQYRLGLGMSPRDATLHGRLGNALALAGLPEEAVDHLYEALWLRPNDAVVHGNLAALHRQAARPAMAMHHQGEAGRLRRTGATFPEGRLPEQAQ